MKICIKDNQNGVAIILVVLMITILLFLGMFFITNSLTEKMIADSQSAGVNTYYLAEAGINEMIWLIVNDSLYEDNFKYVANWSTTTLRTDVFGPGTGQYEVTASNTSAAHCDITAVGRYDIGNGNFAQRILKINVFRAVGTSPVEDSAGYADGNITITNSYVNFLGGSAHSNNTFDVNNQNVQIIVDTDLRAVGNYLEHNNASTTIEGWIYADNWDSYANGTGTADEIDMPAIDFNSAAATSYKNRAISSGEYFTESEFDDLICDRIGSNLTLTKEVTYVDGSVELGGDIELRYPPTGGVLVVEGDFIVGAKNYKQCGGTKHYGKPDVTFVHVAPKPSGVLSSRKVMFLANTGIVNIEGVVYANAEMDLKNLGTDPLTSSFYVAGGLIAQKLDIDSCYGWPTIRHDTQTLIDTIGAYNDSPTVIIEHWEEEY